MSLTICKNQSFAKTGSITAGRRFIVLKMIMKLWVASHKHVNMNFVDLLFMMNNTFYDHYLKLHLSQTNIVFGNT